jgi:hypothetical protein
VLLGEADDASAAVDRIRNDTHNSILDFEAQSSMDNKKWGIYGGRVQIGMGDYKSVPYPVFQKLLKDILELDSLNTHHAGYAESLVRLFQKHKIKKLRGYKQVKEFEKKLNEMEKLRAEIFEKQQQLKRQG